MKGSLTQPVEPQDSADNELVHEVIGNKTDTVGGDSLVSLTKQVLAAGTSNLAVPAQDAAANTDVCDVVGNKTDTTGGDSLVSLAKIEAAARLVPPQDAPDNTDIADVVGNKTDTIAGDSLYSQHMITRADLANIDAAVGVIDTEVGVIDGLHDVPLADSAANTTMRDVIGNKTDREAGDSLYAMLHTLKEHFHGKQLLYPPAANAITLTANGVGGGWTNGAWVEIVPVSTIGDPFDIHSLFISAPSGNGEYEIDIAAGETVIGTTSFVRSSPFVSSIEVSMMTEVQPANTQIKARVRTSDDGGQTCAIKLRYHVY